MARLPYEYPGWVPPVSKPSQPSRPSVNSGSRNAREEKIAAAMGSPLPIVYGHNILKPLIFAIGKESVYLYLGCAWCLGEIEQIVQIYDGDTPLPVSSIVANYTGTVTQLPDPDLARTIPGYADTLVTTVRGEQVSVAYSVIRVHTGSAFPNLSAEVLGKRSWRHGTITLYENALPGVPNTTATQTRHDATATPVDAALAVDGNDGTFAKPIQCTIKPAADRSPVPATFDVSIEALLTQSVKLEDKILIKFFSKNPRSRGQAGNPGTVARMDSADLFIEYRDAVNAWNTLTTVSVVPVAIGSRIVTMLVDYYCTEYEIDVPIATPQDLTGIRVTFKNVIWSGYTVTWWSGSWESGSYVTAAIIPEMVFIELEVHAFFSVQFQYSNNAALCLGDLIEDKAYGLGVPVNEESLKQATEWCEEQMSDGTLRHRLDLAFTTRQPIQQYVETLRMYAGCYVVKEGDEAFLIPDRPTAVTDAVTEEEMVEGTFSMQQQSMRETPNVVSAIYTDPSDTPNWTNPQHTQYHPDLAAGLTEYRRNDLRLEGLHEEKAAKRMAIKRLNYFNLVNLNAECVVMDKAVHWRVGDVIQVSHTWGLRNKPMRLTEINAIGEGRYRCSFEEYDPKIYSDVIETVPSYPDTALHLPTNVPTVVLDDPGPDGSGRIVVSWSAIGGVYPYPHKYRISVGSNTYETELESYTLPPLAPGNYSVTVTVIGTWQGIVHTGTASAAKAFTA